MLKIRDAMAPSHHAHAPAPSSGCPAGCLSAQWEEGLDLLDEVLEFEFALGVYILWYLVHASEGVMVADESLGGLTPPTPPRNSSSPFPRTGVQQCFLFRWHP